MEPNGVKEVNTALFYCYKLVKFYQQNLKDKSLAAQQKAAKRELSKLSKQVLSFRGVFYRNNESLVHLLLKVRLNNENSKGHE